MSPRSTDEIRAARKIGELVVDALDGFPLSPYQRCAVLAGILAEGDRASISASKY